MTELVLIRGLPGSGKSTMAINNYPNHLHFEADQFFTDEEGNYKFEKNMVGRAHKTCISDTFNALSRDLDVVVSNTFTTFEEIKPYLDLPYDTMQIVDLSKRQFKTIHCVPDEVMSKMLKRWEPIESIREKMREYNMREMNKDEYEDMED